MVAPFIWGSWEAIVQTVSTKLPFLLASTTSISVVVDSSVRQAKRIKVVEPAFETRHKTISIERTSVLKRSATPAWSGPRGAALVERPAWSDLRGATCVKRPAWSGDRPLSAVFE